MGVLQPPDLRQGLGFARFARRLLRASDYRFLFLILLRYFSSDGSPLAPCARKLKNQNEKCKSEIQNFKFETSICHLTFEICNFPVQSTRYECFRTRGFPHSDTAGSQLLGNFPATIAAMRVLHRPLMPRHPLSALLSRLFILATKIGLSHPEYRDGSTFYSLVKERS